MGNQASSPESPGIPPLPVQCDLDCQRQNQLAQLKTAMDNADPTNNEKERIAYYTLLNGQGWLAKEKERIARTEVEPVLNEYNTRYKEITSEKKSQAVFTNLSDFLESQQKVDSSNNKFLKELASAEKDKKDIMNRMNQLQVSPVNTLSVGADVVIVFMIIILGGMIYSKMTRVL